MLSKFWMTILVGIVFLTLFLIVAGIAKSNRKDPVATVMLILAGLDIIVTIIICIITYNSANPFKNSIPIEFSRPYSNSYSSETTVYRLNTAQGFTMRISSSESENLDRNEEKQNKEIVVKIYYQNNTSKPTQTQTVDLSISNEIHCDINNNPGDYYIVVEPLISVENEAERVHYLTDYKYEIVVLEDMTMETTDDPLSFFNLDTARPLYFDEEISVLLGVDSRAETFQIFTDSDAVHACSVRIKDVQNDDNKTLQLNIALIQVSENKNTIVFQNNDFLSYADEDGFYQSESVELIDDLPLYLVVFSSEDFEKELLMCIESLKTNANEYDTDKNVNLIDEKYQNAEAIDIPWHMEGTLFDYGESDNELIYKFELFGDKNLNVFLSSDCAEDYSINTTIIDSNGKDYLTLELDNRKSVTWVDAMPFSLDSYYIIISKESLCDVPFTIDINEAEYY